jgi:predicted enzyme related to lactoylglutathione lyase
MTNSVTHFEIYAEEPVKLAEFYRSLFGWQIEKVPALDYWRIQTDSAFFTATIKFSQQQMKWSHLCEHV